MKEFVGLIVDKGQWGMKTYMLARLEDESAA